MPVCKLLPGGRLAFWHQGQFIKMEPGDERFVPRSVYDQSRGRLEVVVEDESVVARERELQMFTTDVDATMTETTDVVRWPLRLSPEAYLRRYGTTGKYSELAQECLGKE